MAQDREKLGSFAPLNAKGYRLGVAPQERYPGMRDLTRVVEDQVPMLHCPLSLQAAFGTTWQDTDAHFVTYYVQSPEGAQEVTWPRVNKLNCPALQQIRTAGGDVRASILVWDWDTKNKLHQDGKKYPIDRAHLEFFWDRFLAMPPAVLEWAKKFTYYYTTRHGIRLVYVLETSLPVDRSEQVHKFMTRQLRESGVEVDELSDWTRMFRLPRTFRDGRASPGPSDLFEEVWQPYMLDPVAMIGPNVLEAVASQRVVHLDYAQPAPDDTVLLIGAEGNRPSWWAQVKASLASKHCYTTVYEDRCLSPANGRMLTLQSFTGEVCVALAKAKRKGEDVGPAHAYAMLFSATAQLEPDENPSQPDWLTVLWRAAQSYWAAELNKIESEKVKDETRLLEALSATDVMLKGMRLWCAAPELRQDDGSAFTWAAQHLLVGTPNGLFHIMTRSGFYDPVGVKTSMIRARVRELGMECLIPLSYKDQKKGVVQYHVQQLIDAYATSVLTIEGHAAGPGNYVRNMRGDHPTMIFQLYKRREDIEPAFNEDIDMWLRQLGSDEAGYRKITAWIGHALAFDEGAIAALALIGSRGVGKKMVAVGLAECITTRTYADASDLGKYNENLLKSPFMCLIEGLKRGKDGYDPADSFRLLTGGDPIKVDAKYKNVVEVKAPIRVLILANNMDVLANLAGYGRNLSQDDKSALAQRLVIVRVKDECQNWLRLQGGHAWTRGWIADDAGGFSSDFVLARHFLWLHANRPAVEFGNRFLMEGDPADHVVETLSTRSGHAPLIIEVLVAMIEAGAAGRSVQGFYIQEKETDETMGAGPLPRVWVTANACQGWAKRPGSGFREVPSREVPKVYRGLQRRGEPDSGRELELPTLLGKQRAQWTNLDLAILLQQAYELGYPCAALEGLVERTNEARIDRLRDIQAKQQAGGVA